MTNAGTVPGSEGPPITSQGSVRHWWSVGARGLLAIAFGLVAIVVPNAAILALVIFFATYAIIDGAIEIAFATRAHPGWPWLTLDGIVSIAAGGLALAWPGFTVLAFLFLLALWSMISGALMMFAAIKFDPAPGRIWLGLSGSMSIAFGALLVAAPLAGVLVLTWWIAAYAILFGLLLLALAVRLISPRRPVMDPSN